jgi:hypothetical protein
MDLEALSLAIQVRRPDVRKAVTALHQQGLVDALRLRLSLAGFAIGTALRAKRLPSIARPRAKPTARRASAA